MDVDTTVETATTKPTTTTNSLPLGLSTVTRSGKSGSGSGRAKTVLCVICSLRSVQEPVQEPGHLPAARNPEPSGTATSPWGRVASSRDGEWGKGTVGREHERNFREAVVAACYLRWTTCRLTAIPLSAPEYAPGPTGKRLKGVGVEVGVLPE